VFQRSVADVLTDQVQKQLRFSWSLRSFERIGHFCMLAGLSGAAILRLYHKKIGMVAVCLAHVR